MNKVIYYYSACVGIHMSGISVLCDPWFTDGAYYGSWYQYPKLENPVEKIGVYDYIFVSHLHEDHYDPIFLKEYLKSYPESKVIIANRKHNYLARLIEMAGLESFVLTEPLQIGTTTLEIIPYKPLDKAEVDSALHIRCSTTGHSVLNINDIPIDLPFHASIMDMKGSPTCLLAGYTGAGPYPQTYFDTKDEVVKQKASCKMEAYLRIFQDLCYLYKPDCAMPFAGKYFLGGRLMHLNDYRGVADAILARDYYEHVLVPDDGGDAFIDLTRVQCRQQRVVQYDSTAVKEYLYKTSNKRYSYENNCQHDSIADICKLLETSFARARLRYSEIESAQPVKYSFPQLGGWDYQPLLETIQPDNDEEDLIEWSISMDLRLLEGIIRRKYHWDNAEIGSHIQVRRSPDKYCRIHQKFLSFVHL